MAAALGGQTLTNDYNAVDAYRGTDAKAVKLVEPARKFAPRLAELHDALDKAVLEMYG